MGGATSSAKVAGKLGQALSFNGTSDGVADGSSAITNASTVSTNLLVGGDDGSSNYHPEAFDDVRIYNRALSAAEVKQLYLIGK